MTDPITNKHLNTGGSMRFTKIRLAMLPAVCAIMILMSSAAISQAADSLKTATAKSAGHAKQLSPQTTCPVMGEHIDKSKYVDYNEKRIYVCCGGCLAEVKKNPEKYIKKLESMGQGVEIIDDGTKKESKDIKADTSMKGMKMSGDTATNATETGYWTCTMHPEIHKAEAGKCPICGMNLVFRKNEKKLLK